MGASVQPEPFDPHAALAEVRGPSAGPPSGIPLGQQSTTAGFDPHAALAEVRGPESSPVETVGRDVLSGAVSGLGQMVGEIPRQVGQVGDVLSNMAAGNWGNMIHAGLQLPRSIYHTITGTPSPASDASPGPFQSAMEPIAAPFASAVEKYPNMAAAAIRPSNPSSSVPGWAQRASQLAGSVGAQALVGKAAGSLMGGATPVEEPGIADLREKLANYAPNAIADMPTKSPAALAPGGTMADAFPELARDIRGKSPAARQIMDATLTQRATNTMPQIQSGLENALGVRQGSLADDLDTITQQRGTEAKPAYAAAYAAPPIKDPSVLETLQLPEFQKAYQIGQSLARLEHVTIPDLPAPMPKEYAGNQKMVAAYQAQNPMAAEGVPIQAIDYAKRGVDAMIRQKGGTDGLGPTQARAMGVRLNEMLQTVDAQAPEYANARKTFAQPSQLLDAAQQGHDDFGSLNTSARDVKQSLSGMSQAEQELYKRGAQNQLTNIMENTAGSADGSADLVRKVYSSVGGQKKIETLIGDPAKFQQFDQQMQSMAQQRMANRMIMGGSQTTDKALSAALFDQPTAAQRVGNLVTNVVGMGTNPKATAFRLANQALTANAATANAAKAAALAQHMVAPTDVTLTKLRAPGVAPLPAGRLAAGNAAMNWASAQRNQPQTP